MISHSLFDVEATFCGRDMPMADMWQALLFVLGQYIMPCSRFVIGPEVHN